MASKRRLRRKQCENKVGHDTLDAAITAKKRMIANNKVNARTLYPYKCSRCGKYHLGHLPAKVVENAA